MTLLDRFELTRPIGMGTSGAVFEAVDRNTSQTIALKLLHRCEPTDLYRVKNEFRALSELAHPNLVAMHELFVDEQQRGFFTMELIQGYPFLQYVRPSPSRGSPLPLELPGAAEERLRACLLQLAQAVSYLHANGKQHRDLKPSNVLVNPASGRLTIVDFGLVYSPREADDAAHGERPTFVGTPAYAAPEQIEPRARARAADFASDWYSVGVMLYEALAGQRPFANTEVLQEKALRDPPPPSAANPALLCPELEHVCLRLLERDPSKRAGGKELLAALGSSAPPHHFRRLPLFAGRDAELARLRAAFERALSGPARACCIRGPSGIGKTSLAHALLDELRENGRAQVLRGRCYVREALHFNALDGIMDAVTNHLRALPVAELERVLPSDVGALAQLFPVLRRIPRVELAARSASAADATHPRAPELEKRAVRARAYASLRQLLARLAEGAPLVLFIDDLQWADADSARLLQELLSPPIPSLWLLATERDDAGLQGAVLDRVGAGEHGERFALGPLSADAVAALAQREGIQREGAAQIARRSGGHPMFACELIRHAQDGGGTLESIALEAALHARLRTLSREAQDLLELVCLAGQRLPQTLLFNGHALPQLAALRELRVASAVRDSVIDQEQHVEPYHDRISEVVIAQLPASRRQALHSELAERMRARGSAYLERAIQRYVMAGREREAADLAEEAAQQAADGLAFHSAAQLVELALDHTRGAVEQRRLRLLAADVCGQAGLTLASAEHCAHAAELVSDPEERAELKLRAATGYCIAGHGRRGLELLKQLTSELGMPFLHHFSVPLGLIGMASLLLFGSPSLRDNPDPPARMGKHPRRTLRLLWRIAPSLMMVEPRQSTDFAANALWFASELGERVVYAQALSYFAALPAFLVGRPSQLIERQMQRAEQLVADDGDIWERAFVRCGRAAAASFTAQDARAIELVDDIAMASQLDSSPFASCVRSSARTVLLMSLPWLGRLDQLSELTQAWTKDAVDSGDRQMQVSGLIAGVLCHLRRDDVARALEAIESARKVDLDYLHTWLHFEPWWQANVHLYRGQPEQGLAVCDALRVNRHLYVEFYDQMRVVWHLTEGTCAAALAARGVDRARSLAILRRSARGARISVGRRAVPIAAQLAATLAFLTGRPHKARALARRAMDAYEALGSRLHAAAMRLALARLEPACAAEYERASLAAFAAEGVAKPQRFAYMIAPGLITQPE